MKRALLICLAVVTLFCSCAGGKSESSPIKTGDAFSCTVEADLDGRQFTCNLNCKNSANAELEIILPEELYGVQFSLTNGELSARYGESSFPITSGGNAVSSAKLILTALGQAINKSNFKTDANGTKYAEGEVSSHKYRLNFSRESGLPEFFEVKSLNFSCRFKNFKFLE